ncbi:MAG: hypothetical protein QOE70_316 [Chthoniobacter sp.]|jgi:hypothetical protein|nr:hypothetical protein [Chthoniobacter sp.]
MKLSYLTLLSILSLSIKAVACDLCGCYLPPRTQVQQGAFGIYAGVSEQFTHFGSLRFEGQEVDNPTNQYLNSSISQLVIGSSFLDHRLALQVNVPLIYWSFKRPEGFAIERGHVSGLGDVSLLANLLVFKKEALFHEDGGSWSKDGKTAAPPVRRAPDFSATFSLLAGVKLPTGDSDRLKEEFNEVEVEGAPESGIHGHDLTLGTGSYDAVFGGQLYLRYKAVFLQADTQFTLRGDGRHSYHFANDLTWSGGPGVYLIRNDRGSLGLQGVIAGEYKDTDRFQGRVAADTGITTLYVGPRLTAQFGGVSGDVGVDLPVLLDNTALQAVPDYRIRAALSIQF